MANGHMKRCSAPLLMRQRKIKTIWEEQVPSCLHPTFLVCGVSTTHLAECLKTRKLDHTMHVLAGMWINWKSYTADGNTKCSDCSIGNVFGGFLTSIDLPPSHTTPRHFPKRHENVCPHRDLQMNFREHFIQNSSKLETTHPSTDD